MSQPPLQPPTRPPVSTGDSDSLDLGALPPPALPANYGTPGQQRPWWGFGDVLLGFLFFLVLSILGFVIAVANGSVDDLVDLAETGDTSLLPLDMLAISLLFQQLGQGLWPFIVSKWKGLGAVADWRLKFKFSDIGIGMGVAVIGLAAAGAAGWVVGELVNLTDEASADNAQFLRDAEGTPWLAVILFTVVVGAPFTEELFFRGLTLRAIEKRLGSWWGVLLSSIIFTLPHWTGSDWRGTMTLFASIFAVGIVLGAATVITDRIASSIIAHMIFNAFGAAGALGWFDSLAP